MIQHLHWAGNTPFLYEHPFIYPYEGHIILFHAVGKLIISTLISKTGVHAYYIPKDPDVINFMNILIY